METRIVSGICVNEKRPASLWEVESMETYKGGLNPWAQMTTPLPSGKWNQWKH
ncbi:hypothetical protein CRC_03134 [Cylindrospermopsis raciborskii CS-505]|nr:hypothetical protein CRC_03134 [Cylindrospermopsis raciborskii CS-505]